MRASTKKLKPSKPAKDPQELLDSARCNRIIDERNLQKVADLVMQRALNHSLPDQKLILETYGKRKGRPIKIPSGLIKTPHDCAALSTATMALMCDGEITPEETLVVMEVIRQKTKICEVVDLKERIVHLEIQMGINGDTHKQEQQSFPVNPLVQEKLIEARLQAASIENPQNDYIKSLK